MVNISEQIYSYIDCHHPLLLPTSELTVFPPFSHRPEATIK